MTLIQVEMVKGQNYCNGVEQIMKQVGYVFIRRLGKDCYYLSSKLVKK